MAEKNEKRYVSDNAQLMQEWDWEKNNELGLNPKEITSGSGKKVWWKCKKGHEWQAAVNDRKKGHGCKICGHEKAKKTRAESILKDGERTLFNLFSELMSEWDWGKNETLGLDPNRITPGSGKKAWWKCKEGHEWQATILSRSNGTGCPYCNNVKVLIGYNDLLTLNPQVAEEWHPTKNGTLLPQNLNIKSMKKAWWKCRKCGYDWQTSIFSRTASNGTGCPKCKVKITATKLSTPEEGESLFDLYPELTKEWHPTNNGILTPNMVFPGSHKKVWWKCEKGHEWETTIKNRTIGGSSCPFCSNRKVQSEYNDLATTHQIVASEWNYEKNKGLLPTMVPAGSQKKVWWKCSLGHEWDATVVSRVNGTDCPYCSNHKVLEGYNDLATTNPELAVEWNYEKNKDLSPKMVVPGSLKKVWWKCSLGHEWDATVVSRVNGNGCPYCSNHKVLAGFNDLAIKYPDVAKEWHPTKNGSLTPCEVSASSKKKAWWICSKGHEWQAVIGSRTDLRAGCPICNQEMKTSFPEQAILFYLRKITCAESRNNDFGKEIDVYLPEYKIGIEHNGKFYHKDKKEADKQKILFFAERNIRIITVAEGYQNAVHNDIIEYEASTNKESLNWAIRELFKKISLTEMYIDVENDAAEIYSQYIISEKENSLAAKLPEIAQEWNYEKNGLLTPEMISNASGKKVWWKCDKGHEWQAAVNDRKKGHGCPYCSGNKVLKGFNDLQTVNPTLAKEWNFEKNTGLTPEEVMPNSGKKVWWKCDKGHEWQARIQGRNRGSGCPYCSGRKKQ